MGITEIKTIMSGSIIYSLRLLSEILSSEILYSQLLTFRLHFQPTISPMDARWIVQLMPTPLVPWETTTGVRNRGSASVLRVGPGRTTIDSLSSLGENFAQC